VLAYVMVATVFVASVGWLFVSPASEVSSSKRGAGASMNADEAAGEEEE